MRTFEYRFTGHGRGACVATPRQLFEMLRNDRSTRSGTGVRNHRNAQSGTRNDGRFDVLSVGCDGPTLSWDAMVEEGTDETAC